MTARVVLCCDRTWNEFPCRGRYVSRSLNPDVAREQARREGWSGGPGADQCPAHTRILAAPVTRG